MMRLSDDNEILINSLADTIEIPAARYNSADRSYRAVSSWLSRPSSYFADIDIAVYTQGSFRLGTAIRPLDGEEQYDLDVVCEFKMPKYTVTQAELYEALGAELRLYADAKGMTPPIGWDRVWTLNYADEAQFHMDVLPSVPDGASQKALIKGAGLKMDYVEHAVAITDKKHHNFNRLSLEWLISNPHGYANWFNSRKLVILDAMLRERTRKANVTVADIPEFEAKVPLQSAVQILKRHRNMRFSESPKLKPSSIIITTLAAHAYQQEQTVAAALTNILARMDQFIVDPTGDSVIANPSAPLENFADSWRSQPELKKSFFDWLETARIDFNAAAQEANPDQFVDILAPRMGRLLMEESVQKSRVILASRSPIAKARAIVARPIAALARILDAPHRKPAVWPVDITGAVRIESAICKRSGFRPVEITNNSAPVPKRATLEFTAKTNVQKPYIVYWQVVNTGQQASKAGQLRGNFELENAMVRGHLTKVESTLYQGVHSVECFIVKDKRCVAKSEPFIVNIE